jgi:hypothetical protein
MHKVTTGNAASEGQEKGGWFIGHFIDSDKPLRSRTDLEIKWGIHPQGERRASRAPSGEATTITILIRGHFVVILPDQQEIVLAAEGDYVMFTPNQPHETHAITDSVLITVRWPSLPQQF